MCEIIIESLLSKLVLFFLGSSGGIIHENFHLDNSHAIESGFFEGKKNFRYLIFLNMIDHR